MTELDLNKFPIIENIHGILVYQPFKEFPELKNLGDISERIYGCGKFLSVKSDTDYPFYSELVTLRAFLSEFTSLSEMLRQNHRNELKILSIENTKYPLFHFLKLLREVNFHLVSVSGGKVTQTYRMQNIETGEIHPTTYQLEHSIIENCTFNLFENSFNVKHYHKHQLIIVIDWINFQQHEYGIFRIFEETLRQYCRLLSNTIQQDTKF